MGQAGTVIRVVLLLSLLAATPFSALAQTTPPPQPPPAQPAICFREEPHIAGSCTGETAPSYLQGAAVTIEVQSAVVNVNVSVRCIRGCPSPDPSATKVYWAIFTGPDLVFPRDFQDEQGAPATRDQVPRYNSTWRVTAGFTGAPISREFLVWTYDAFVGTNFTVRPGESHYLRSVGFIPGADVSYRWERRDAVTGRFETIRAEPRRASTTGSSVGWFEDIFALPPSEARNITACGGATLDCYRVSISGSGKQPETFPVQVGLAHIKRSLDTTPRQGVGELVDIERSANVSFDIDLYYPGGRLHHGPKLQPRDVPLSPVYGDNVLRVAVEKVYTNGTIIFLDEVPLRYQPLRFVWTAQWTAPKDLEPERNTARYRLRLVEQNDVYGNIVDEDILGNFTVRPAQLIPRAAASFERLERTQEGIISLAVLYHNGSSFTPEDAQPRGNESPLRGCFLRAPDPAPQPAPQTSPQVNACGPNDRLVWGKYADGLWNFSVRFPRDHADLAFYRFVLVDNTPDRYGNNIRGTIVGSFELVPAKPAVAFSTVMRGRDAEVLERGREIFVSATITYHDGSPYNHHVRANPNSSESLVLSGRLLRRGPSPSGEGYGPLAGEEVFNLTETDPTAGRWSGYLRLSDDDTSTPVGIWTFLFDVADNVTVPNRNLTAFDREVVSSTIVVCPTFQPSARVPTGSIVKFRFKLFYSECDTGREVPQAAVVGKLNARIHRWDPARQAIVGAPVSNVLVPSYSSAAEGDWGLEYTVANQLFAGSYVIALAGSDTFGNKLLPSSFSRPFSTYTDIIDRTVVAEPPVEVRRGESATVVFDAREGDTGLDPTRPPRIQLERFDRSETSCEVARFIGGCWVPERFDVRVPDPTLEDHVGVFPVGIDTPVGTYRFTLHGRDRTFHLLSAISGNFTVSPTLVSRALVTTPPERIVKGVPFTFYIEQAPGDRITERVVFLDGRPVALPPPQISNEFGRLNVTWAVPFEAPTGNYTLRLVGRDVNGNDILLLSPPIEALAATLEGRLLGQPPRAVARGDAARILFAVGYPDGSFYASADEPRVLVRNASGVVGSALLRREGLSFAAEWRPPADVPLGEYYFEVSPQATGTTGNAFPPLRSNPFRVVTGVVERPAVDQIGATLERLRAAIYSVPMEADDKYVSFELVYYGPSLVNRIDTQSPAVEITRSPLPHTLDPEAGKYVARLVTDQQSQTGTFRIIMTGEDADGNRIVSTSRQFVITPTTIGVQYDAFPPSRAFGEGKTITLSFVAKYSIGTIMDDAYGRPTVVALYTPFGGVQRPITQRPELEYVDGHWYMTWAAPAILPPGTYEFLVGGNDLHGNPIATARSTPYTITQGTLPESFAKVIPGPSPALLALVVAAAASLLLARRKRA